MGIDHVWFAAAMIFLLVAFVIIAVDPWSRGENYYKACEYAGYHRSAIKDQDLDVPPGEILRALRAHKHLLQRRAESLARGIFEELGNEFLLLRDAIPLLDALFERTIAGAITGDERYDLSLLLREARAFMRSSSTSKIAPRIREWATDCRKWCDVVESEAGRLAFEERVALRA